MAGGERRCLGEKQSDGAPLSVWLCLAAQAQQDGASGAAARFSSFPRVLLIFTAEPGNIALMAKRL